MEAILNYSSTSDDALLQSYFKSIDEKLANNKILKSELNLKTIALKVLLPDILNRCIIKTDPESE
jgi:hypothetical protein